LPKRILVVDDEATIVKILTKRLVGSGYVVLSAANGPEAFGKLANFKPDAILLDVMMPGMDGVQVAERLGRMPSTARTPVIFISALIAPDHPRESPTNPLHFYLGKPFEPEALLGILQRLGL
jgi:CheY-like chemotaxis protein